MRFFRRKPALPGWPAQAAGPPPWPRARVYNRFRWSYPFHAAVFPSRLSASPPFGRATACSCYAIISSARSTIDGGMATPSALAVLRFTTISNWSEAERVAPPTAPLISRVFEDATR